MTTNMVSSGSYADIYPHRITFYSSIVCICVYMNYETKILFMFVNQISCVFARRLVLYLPKGTARDMMRKYVSSLGHYKWSVRVLRCSAYQIISAFIQIKYSIHLCLFNLVTYLPM